MSGGIESLDETLCLTNKPKQLKERFENNLPTIGELISLIHDDTKIISVYDLELLLRSSGSLRLIFNYYTALYYKL